MIVGGDFLERIWKDVIKASVIGFVVPGILLTLVVTGKRGTSAQETTAPSTQVDTTTLPPTSHTQPSTTTQPTQPEPEPQPQVLTIQVLVDGQMETMALEEYVVGVVLAEVPSSFEPEALKAQAVAARTYALFVCGKGRHQGGVCTSYSCCQSYISREAYFDRGGNAQRWDKVYDAVQATAGQVLMYAQKLACTTYFSCSGGQTEDAVAVWGSDIPYLQTVESPGEEFCHAYTDRVIFSAETFQQALCITLPGEPESWFGEVTYTNGGGVDTLQIGGVDYRGTTLRMLLGLRSTMFTVSVTAEGICIETMGYGHRVGMSQYGAQAMALAGESYAAILHHYYLGTELTDYVP